MRTSAFGAMRNPCALGSPVFTGNARWHMRNVCGTSRLLGHSPLKAKAQSLCISSLGLRHNPCALTSPKGFTWLRKAVHQGPSHNVVIWVISVSWNITDGVRDVSDAPALRVMLQCGPQVSARVMVDLGSTTFEDQIGLVRESHHIRGLRVASAPRYLRGAGFGRYRESR